MTDTSHFINVYIDKLVGSTHEFLTQTLQLKTQLHIAQEVIEQKDREIQEKDQRILELQNADTRRIAELQNTDTENHTLRENAARWENEANVAKQKASHVDTALAQVAEMKRIIQDKDAEIESLQKSLNRREKKKAVAAVPEVVTAPSKKVDDF